MTFSWELNTATLLSLATQAVLVIFFLVRSDGRSKSAKEIAEDAKKLAMSAHEKIVMAGEAHGLFREQVAREYVSREALREMEDRLSHSIEGIRERLDKVLDGRHGK